MRPLFFSAVFEKIVTSSFSAARRSLRRRRGAQARKQLTAEDGAADELAQAAEARWQRRRQRRCRLAAR
jgi:hypothetical protein